MDGEFLLGEREELKVRVRNCPACDAEGAQVIEFHAGRVVRCEACGLVDLQRWDETEPGAGAPA